MHKLTDELQNKINDFIKKEEIQDKRPLHREDAKQIILQLRDADVSFPKITEFLKTELNIKVSIQAVMQKYKTLTKDKKDA
mgnify:CR=1 FL=1